jgi:hypothetical protein
MLLEKTASTGEPRPTSSGAKPFTFYFPSVPYPGLHNAEGEWKLTISSPVESGHYVIELKTELVSAPTIIDGVLSAHLTWVPSDSPSTSPKTAQSSTNGTGTISMEFPSTITGPQ